jgi:hypothetical protein
MEKKAYDQTDGASKAILWSPTKELIWMVGCRRANEVEALAITVKFEIRSYVQCSIIYLKCGALL